MTSVSEPLEPVKPAMKLDMSPEIGKLAAALSKAQGEIIPATKDSNNPFFGSKYADLAAIWFAVRGPLVSNELAVAQTLGGDGSNVDIITTLLHSSGQWIRGSLRLKPTKADPQGMGSAITYGRRYSLAAICGVVQEDDDGNAASKQQQGGQTQQKNTAQKAPATGSAQQKTPALLSVKLPKPAPAPATGKPTAAAPSSAPLLASEILPEFFRTEERYAGLYGDEAYKELLAYKNGESPTLEQVTEFKSPKELEWLKRTTKEMKNRLAWADKDPKTTPVDKLPNFDEDDDIKY